MTKTELKTLRREGPVTRDKAEKVAADLNAKGYAATVNYATPAIREGRADYIVLVTDVGWPVTEKKCDHCGQWVEMEGPTCRMCLEMDGN